MKKIVIAITLQLFLVLSAFANTSDFQAHFFINGKKAEGMDHLMVMPNKPTLVEMYFTDPRTDEVYKDYKVMHGKYMHMVLVNSDLSVFKHIHPYFDPITGRFAITINMPYSDPDNQDAVSSLTKPGMYMLMADVIVRGLGMRMSHAMVHVMGQTDYVQMYPDSEVNGVITKLFKRGNESIPEYKAALTKNSISGCNGNIVNFEIEMFHYENGVYEPLLDFQSWLSEAGHAVWMSENYMDHMHGKMPFAHMHSPFVLDDDEDDSNDRVMDHILRFNFHDQGQMLPGLQKIWIQFKHRDKIMKLPFVFSYGPGEGRGC